MRKRNKNGIKKCECCNEEFRYEIPKYCSRLCTDKGNGIKQEFWKNATEEQKFARMKELFEKNVIKFDDPNKCWDWKGQISNRYPSINFHYKNIEKRGNRVSWIIHNGKIPNNFNILHTCDNTRCTNPKHLFVGDHKTNMQDMMRKGRRNPPRGEKNGNAKITDEEAKKIIKLLKQNEPVMKISKLLKISRQIISHIKRGKTWSHLQEG